MSCINLFFLDKQNQPIMIIAEIKIKCAQCITTTSSEGHICSKASFSDNGDGSNGCCSGDKGCGIADAGIIVRDGEDNENKSSPNEPGHNSDSAESSEDNDNLNKDTTILNVREHSRL